MLKFFYLLFFFGVPHLAFSQSEYFEGSVTYFHEEFDRNGRKKSTPVVRDKIFFSKDIILTKVISGPSLQLFGNFQVYLNSNKKVRYTINHDEQAIKDEGLVRDIETIQPLEEKIIGEEEIHGYKCDVHFLKFVHQFDLPSGRVSDTLSCTYYSSKTLKFSKPREFGILQGNRNWLLLDGRYDGIPLKIVRKNHDGSIIKIDSEEIKQMNVDDAVKLPDYTFKE